MRLGRWLVVPLLVLGCFALAACGGGGNKTSSTGAAKKAATGGVKQGGSITIAGVGPDAFDPVMEQTVQANSANHLVYTGLTAYKDATGTEGSKLIPGVADSIPQPTNGGKTYTFHIRDGLKYSDGEPVKASDFENMMKRMIYLGGPFSSFYFSITGASDYASAKKQDAPLPGIKVDDKANTVTLNLDRPNTQILYAVGLVNAGLTPKSKSPFKVVNNSPPPGVGPYTMKVVTISPTHGKYILTKNPTFNIPGMAKGNLDKITGLMSTNVNKMTEDIISGKADYTTEDPVGDLLPQVEQKYKDRFLIGAGYPNVYYFFMNVTIPPFDKVEARQAVNYAIDSRALERVFGGRLHPSCNFLPPNVVGYQEIKGADCPWGDPAGPGDMAKAKALIKQAGLTGQKVTVWTNTKDPRPAIADYLRSILTQMGFKTSTKTLNQTVYFSTIGSRKTKAQIGFTDWFQDYPHPGDFFGNLLTTDAAKAAVSFNQGFVEDKHIDSEVNKLNASPPEQGAAGWAALDKYVNDPKQAYVAVYGNEEDTAFYSSRMDVKQCSGYPHPVFRVDWSLLCLK